MTNNRLERQKKIQTIMKWFGYPSGSFGIVGTIHLWKTGEHTLAIVTAFASVGLIFLAMFANFVCDVFNRVVEKIEDKLEEKAEPLASYIVEGLEDYVVKGWWRLTAKFEAKYYQQLIYDCRDYKTYGLKTKGSFTFELDKIFVPLQVCPESLEQISSEIIRNQENKKGVTIWDFLVKSKNVRQFKEIAIIGTPGSGKTTLLKDLTLTYAQNRHRRQNPKAPKLIPILIYLRDVRDVITYKNNHNDKYSSNFEINLPAVIVQQKSIAKLKPREGWFEELLLKKNCLVMLDGLDEVANDSQRKAVSNWVNEQINNYRKACFIVTSRPFGYKLAPIENINTILDVQSFSLEQVKTFIHNWYLQREIMSRLGKDDQGVRDEAENQANDLIDRIIHNPNLASLALNPLLLTMIATVHCYRGALPGRRVELYAEISDVLLGKRDRARGISIDLTPEQQKVVLQVLAFKLTVEHKTREFSLELGSELIAEKLQDVAGSNLKPNCFIKSIEKRSGLLIERENNLYEFAHKSFQEYLTAVQIKESNKESILIDNLSDSWWEETIRLYSAQTDASNLIESALQNFDVHSLTLALNCCDEAREVKAAVKEKLYHKIEQGLESSNKNEFELAVRVKLNRRLSNLLRINENLAVDMEYITSAEYQLFINNHHNLPEKIEYPEHWKNGHFPQGDSQKPITGISQNSANQFCGWLGINYMSNLSSIYCCRLLKVEERNIHSAPNDDLANCGGLRLAINLLPLRYERLAYLLAWQNWQEADRETSILMMEFLQNKEGKYIDEERFNYFPCQDLFLINQLWLDYSNDKFGFTVQKQIWHEITNSIFNETPQKTNLKINIAGVMVIDLGSIVDLFLKIIPQYLFYSSHNKKRVKSSRLHIQLSECLPRLEEINFLRDEYSDMSEIYGGIDIISRRLEACKIKNIDNQS